MISIIKNEIAQNPFHFLLIVLISLLLGASLNISYRAEQKIAALTNSDSWNADLVVLPKGVSLLDLKSEMQSNQTSDFLPVAMFDTMVDMAKDQFKLTAVLPITDENGKRIMVKGNSPDTGLQWLGKSQTLGEWKVQSIYGTPEWKNNVMAGFFAAGPAVMMQNLKELIDKKTVGQAIFIKQQQAHDEQNRMQLQSALAAYSGTLITLIVLSFLSLLLWLRIRLANTLSVLAELGYAKSSLNIMLSLLFLTAVGVPLIAGVLAGNLMSVF